jgi:lactoylglutathione lyase
MDEGEEGKKRIDPSFKGDVSLLFLYIQWAHKMRILHASITVKDMDESLRFYCDTLGLKLARRREIPENNAEIAFVQGEDGSNLALELTYWRGKSDWTDGDQLDHIALSVEDVKSAVETLRRKGVEIAKEPYTLKGSNSVIAFIKDPNGIWIELVKWVLN